MKLCSQKFESDGAGAPGSVGAREGAGAPGSRGGPGAPGSVGGGGLVWRMLPGAMGVLLSVGALVITGCQDEVRRYETLSFFFDGVPAPEGYELEDEPEALIGPWGVQVDADSELGREMLAKREAGPTMGLAVEPDKVFNYHTPYKKRDCFGCHVQAQGYRPPDAGGELCGKCHESYQEFEADDWVHGPVAVGECGWCHEPHKSEFKGLLKESQPGLCMSCHEESVVDYNAYHKDKGDARCSDCHDPHASGNRLLLADSRTYERRAKTLALLPSPHAGWPKDLCRSCHVPERSNELTEEVDSTCLSCHGEFDPPGPTDPNLHGAMKEGNCTTCHMPHRSKLPNLLRVDAEKKCYQCHTLEEVRSGDHPNVTRVDCLLCHNGHSSERASLLKDGISVGPGPVEQGGAP